MRVRSWMGGFAVVACCTAGSAFAAIDASRVGSEVKFDEQRTKVGLDARVGVGGLTGDGGEVTAPGPLLGITAAAQPWRNLGIEAGIEGQRLPINDARIVDEQALYRYNLGVMAKAGPLVLQEKVRPYVGAGVGVSYLNVTDGAETLYGNDIVQEVPLAAGVDYRFNESLFAGARASYRILFGTEFADAATGTGDTGGNLLNFAATVGGRF
ncbi:MAG TPA: outer membrane beta-barrel protein [Archangium sp.]|uniref:outer membrane beta-barrel protein n=1 Tax=Archangium sp. TaxID=1872627 RepID=UPI002ED7AB11